MIQKFYLALFAYFMTLPIGSASANNAPKPTQLGLKDPATPQMERIVDFHFGLLLLIAAIVAFVTVLLIWVAIRYNEK